MIAEFAPSCSEARSAAPDDSTDVVDIAFVWAALNVLESDGDVAGTNVVRAARASFSARLSDLGMTTADLFDLIADAVEHGDWAALGLEDESALRRPNWSVRLPSGPAGPAA